MCEKQKSVERVHKNADLMLQIAVLALCIFSDDDDVDVSVARLNSRKWLAVHHIGVQIQTRADREREREIERDIERETAMLRVNGGELV